MSNGFYITLFFTLLVFLFIVYKGINRLIYLVRNTPENLELKNNPITTSSIKRKSGQASAIFLLFFIGTFLIIVGTYLIQEAKLYSLITTIGIIIGVSAGIVLFYRILIVDEFKIELNKPIEMMKSVMELNSSLAEKVNALKDEILILHHTTENGLLNIYPNRVIALNSFINAIDSEDDEIVVFGSSLKGVLQNEEYAFFKNKLILKLQNGVKIRFMLTHPKFADLRGKPEHRNKADIGKEIIESLEILRKMEVPSEDVRLYKGAPTIFAIKTKSRMLINPYPYHAEAMSSPCFEVEANKPLYNFYSKYHFGAWRRDSAMVETIVDLSKKIAQLAKELPTYNLRYYDFYN